MASPIRYLDTETTGLAAGYDEVLQLAILDEDGQVLLDTLVRPTQRTSWPAAGRIHGITPAQVRRPDLPTLAELQPLISSLLIGSELRIYNADFDTVFLRDALAAGPPARVVCLMLAFAEHRAQPSGWGDGYQWQPLSQAAAHVLHDWGGPAHSALADSLAARAVAQYLFQPETRARIDQEATRRREAERALRHEQQQQAAAQALLVRWEQQRATALRAVNDTWTRQHYPQALAAQLPPTGSAETSAELFCRHLTGHSLWEWQTYGESWLALPRYGLPARVNRQGLSPLPDHLRPRGMGPGGVYFLQTPPAPVGLLVRKGGAQPQLQPVYDVRGFRVGVDYVPFVLAWPAGYCSITALRKRFGLSTDQLANQRPALVKRTQHGNLCLLYPEPAALPVAA